MSAVEAGENFGAFEIISLRSSRSSTTNSSSLSLHSSENEALMRNDVHSMPAHDEADEWNDNYSDCEGTDASGPPSDTGKAFDPPIDDQSPLRWESMLEEALKREGIPIQPRKYEKTFKEAGMLGKGAYGHVFLVEEKDTQISYAMKKVSIPLDPELVYKLVFEQRAQKTAGNTTALRRSSEITPDWAPLSTVNTKKATNPPAQKRRSPENTANEKGPETTAWKHMATKIMQKLMAEVDTMRKLWSKPSAHSANIIKFYGSWLELTTTPISAPPIKMIKYGLPPPCFPAGCGADSKESAISSKITANRKVSIFSESMHMSATLPTESDSSITGGFISNTFAKTRSNLTRPGTDLSGQPVLLPPRPQSPASDPLLLEERIPRSMLMASQRRQTSWGLENQLADSSVPVRPKTPECMQDPSKSMSYYNDTIETLGYDEDSAADMDQSDSSSTASSASLFGLNASDSIHNIPDRPARPTEEDACPKKPQSSQSSFPKFCITLYIQMEVCSSNSLYKWLWEPGRMIQPEQNLKLFQQLISGLAHVHERGYFHRDVKPDNLMMVYSKGVPSIKLGDFGLTKKMKQFSTARSAVPSSSKDPSSSESSRMGDVASSLRGEGGTLLLESHTKGRGTANYMAPELWCGGQYTEKVDIYAAGIVLLELFSCWTTGSERIYAFNNLKEHRLLDESLTSAHPEIAKLILAMTQHNPDLRPSALDILSHPALSSRIQLLRD